jgi:hypothetical protein
MSGTLIVEQLLNGLQFGLMLFLIAAGLTLVFGILDILNVAHGSLYRSVSEAGRKSPSPLLKHDEQISNQSQPGRADAYSAGRSFT